MLFPFWFFRWLFPSLRSMLPGDPDQSLESESPNGRNPSECVWPVCRIKAYGMATHLGERLRKVAKCLVYKQMLKSKWIAFRKCPFWQAKVPFHCIYPFTVKEESIYGIFRLLVSFHYSYFFCLLDFELLSENGCWNQVTEANTESQGWCVCCFEVQRNAPKMSSKNGRKQNEKAQKARTERRKAL